MQPAVIRLLLQALIQQLGVGKMQMTEIAKALSEDAKVLILDEPTSALAEDEINGLMEILRTLKSHGITCIYITHQLEEFFGITDSISVLRDGKLITTQPAENLSVEMLVQYMVGRNDGALSQGQSAAGQCCFRGRKPTCPGPRRSQPRGGQRCDL